VHSSCAQSVAVPVWDQSIFEPRCNPRALRRAKEARTLQLAFGEGRNVLTGLLSSGKVIGSSGKVIGHLRASFGFLELLKEAKGDRSGRLTAIRRPSTRGPVAIGNRRPPSLLVLQRSVSDGAAS
jgi:hypothetical protein